MANGGAILHGIDPAGAVSLRRRAAGTAGAGAAPAALAVRSLDAALVAPGNVTSPWEWDAYQRPGTNSTHPAAVGCNPLDGFAFNLFNNLWSTNYILWYPWRAQDASSRFRFRFSLSSDA